MNRLGRSAVGKVIGTLLGLLAGGIIGAVAGFLVGYVFDFSREALVRRARPVHQSHTSDVFFATTFAVMGHLAKADGRVSESEIQAAEHVMREMRLNDAKRAEARILFRQGKSPEFDLHAALDEFNEACGRRLNLKMMFLQIQFSAVWADGDFSQSERDVLVRIAQRLGVPEQIFRQIEAMVGAFARRASGGAWQDAGRSEAHARHSELRDAYAILGIDPKNSDEEIKRAYRKLMNQHHPDKLIAKGLPEEMMEVATRRAAEIQNAYELVKRSRGA